MNNSEYKQSIAFHPGEHIRDLTEEMEVAQIREMDHQHIELRHSISPEMFCRLREQVNFQKVSQRQAKKILENTSYICAAFYNNEPVGVIRLLFDYGTDAYITDVIVNPDYQGCGIGRLLIENVLNYIRQNVTDTKVVCSLYANQGKEDFYHRFGFEKLPNIKYGYGMVLDV